MLIFEFIGFSRINENPIFRTKGSVPKNSTPILKNEQSIDNNGYKYFMIWS